MFNNYNLTDDEAIEIIDKYEYILNKYSEINGRIDEDLKEEIKIYWYRKFIKNRKF